MASMPYKKEQVKKQLDHELSGLHFTSQKHVLEQLHAITWKEKVASFWNKEIELPLLPISAVFMLLIVGFGAKELLKNPHIEEQTVIKAGGSFYWKDDFERMVLKNEN